MLAAVSLQKIVHDKLEGIQVTAIYFGLCWASIILCNALLAIGLWNTSLALSEKGFYIMVFLLSLFGAVAVQKNIRDLDYLRSHIQSPSVPHYTNTEFQPNRI